MDAVREVVLNAIIHRDYTSSSDSIVKIFDDRIEIYNPGRLPAGLTVEKLLKGDYRSSVRNRKIADMFKEVGLVEKYGSGIRRIVHRFREYGLPVPRFQEISDGFMVTMYKAPSEVTGEVTGGVTEQVTPEVTPEVAKFLPLCEEPKSRKELQQLLGLKDEEHFRKAYLIPALENGYIERTIPDKPQSRLQKYRLTAKGKAVLKMAKRKVLSDIF